MEKKTVWVINQFAGTPQSGWGERHFYLAKYWKKNGFDVKIISGSYNHMFTNLPNTTGLYTIENFDGIEFCWVKTPIYDSKSILRFYSMLIFAWNVFRMPTNILGKPSTVIISSMPIFPIWTGVQIKKKFNAKLIFEIRDLWPLSLQLLGGYTKNHFAVKFIGWFEKLGYRKSDEIVSLLPNSKEHIEDVAKKKVSFNYIPNGIEESLLCEDINLNDQFPQIPKGKFLIAYTGTVGIANAMEYFIEASILLKEDPRFHFLIVGDGYLLDGLKSKTINNDNITFIDKVRKDQVQMILSKVDICYLSWHKTELYNYGVSANKYFDYMLAAKPILVSSDQIVDPVKLSNCGIIVNAESSSAICEGMKKLYNLDKSSLLEMGERGKIYVQKNHTYKKLAFQYQQLFQ